MDVFAALADRVKALVSPLSPQACESRLAERVTDPLILPSHEPITGWARGGVAHLRWMGRYRQDPVTVLDATFEASGEGTRITCRTYGSVIDNLGTLVLGMVGGFAAITGLNQLLGGVGLTLVGLQWFLIPAAGVAIGMALLILRRCSASKHHAMLITFLAETVQAQAEP